MTRTPLLVGITGGIGSGKSTVCKIFASLDVPVYDSDSRAKNLMTTDGILINQIRKEFGDLSYNESGALNREYLSKTVFNDKTKLEKLNNLVHPRVAYDSERWIKENSNYPYLLKEAALLFESGAYKMLDKMIVVTAPESIRVRRVIQRDVGKTEEDVIKIIRSQYAEADNIKRADYVIANNEKELLIPQVLKLHELFIR